jgi:hypothetical protein
MSTTYNSAENIKLMVFGIDSATDDDDEAEYILQNTPQPIHYNMLDYIPNDCGRYALSTIKQPLVSTSVIPDRTYAYQVIKNEHDNTVLSSRKPFSVRHRYWQFRL